jgi:hypothetical protein
MTPNQQKQYDAMMELKATEQGASGIPASQVLNAQTGWFHMFHQLIQGGDLAKMGPYAFAVYAVIKSHVNFETGESFPSVEVISEKSGVSTAQVKRALGVLVELGYLLRGPKVGRHNNYTVREKLQITDATGSAVDTASWDYMPPAVGAAIRDLRNVLMTGDLAGAKIIQIESVHINIALAGSSQVNVGTENSGSIDSAGHQNDPVATASTH